MGAVADAFEVASPYLDAAMQEIHRRGLVLRLWGLLAAEDGPSLTYARRTAEACESVGVHYTLRRVEPLGMEAEIMAANADPCVHGIIVYYPVLGDQQDSYLREIVDLKKDVEGLNARYRYNLYHDVRYLDDARAKKSILPCTPLAVVKILEHFRVYEPGRPVGHQIDGKTACVVNRSEIVGRPLAAMLAHDGGLVYSCDINGVQVFRGHEVEPTDLQAAEVIPQADILVTGVPNPAYKVPTSLVKEGAFVVNIAHVPNVDLDVVTRAAGYVPSIGRVTIAMLIRNLLRLHDNFGGNA